MLNRPKVLPLRFRIFCMISILYDIQMCLIAIGYKARTHDSQLTIGITDFKSNVTSFDTPYLNMCNWDMQWKRRWSVDNDLKFCSVVRLKRHLSGFVDQCVTPVGIGWCLFSSIEHVQSALFWSWNVWDVMYYNLVIVAVGCRLCRVNHTQSCHKSSEDFRK